MADFNYIQVLAYSDISKKVSASVEWSSIERVQYVREAIQAKKLKWRGSADEFSIESIARVSGDKNFAWSSSIGRHFSSKDLFSLSGFYSDVSKRIFLRDRMVVLINGDTYLLGKRVGCIARWQVRSDFEVSGLLSQRLDSTPGHRLRGQLAIRYKLSPMLTRMIQRR